MKKINLVIIVLTFAVFHSCDDGKLNFFSVDQDIQFGQQLDSAILANPTDYPILSPTDYPEAYDHLDRIVSSILSSGELRYANRFAWEAKIIDMDILNAFVAPGGYMYFYTGLIKFLDNEAQFAGVVAHEIAHADRRHSTQMLTKQYGFSVLAGVLLGDDPTMLEKIIADLTINLGALQYSRKNEYEADEYAVKYLADTNYNPLGVAGFFEKLEGYQGVPEFLSTHPSPDNRIEAIYAVWESLGSPVGDNFVEIYQDFKDSLP